MVYISSLQTPMEKYRAEQAALGKIAEAEEAQNSGISVKEYKQNKKQRAEDQKYISKVKAAISQKNDNELASLLKSSPNFNFSKKQPYLFRYVAVQRNENAFRYLLEHNIPCGYDTTLGKNALTTLNRRSYAKYFNILIEHGCDLGVNDDPIPLISAFANSMTPELVLKYPLTEKNKVYYELAFLKTILNKKTKAALTFIERGVNPNARAKLKPGKYHALQFSIIANEPEVAKKLIEKGADLVYMKYGIPSRYTILMALQFKQVDVARLILEQDKKVISREKIGDQFFIHALSQSNADLRFAAINLGFKYGLKATDFKDEGVNTLLRASGSANYELVEALLKAGVNPNKPINMRMPISSARISRDHPAAKKVIELLLKHGAKENYLELIKDERGINDASNCISSNKVGNIIKLDGKLEIPFKNASLRKIYKMNDMLRWKNGTCLVNISLCADAGIGADDCVKSLNTCIETNTQPTLKDISFCCSSDAKQRYTEARCSSLSVSESIKWMKLFH